MIWPLLVGASILLNGFFAGMEAGITSARRVRLVHLARQGRRGAGLASELVRHRERSVVAAVVGSMMKKLTRRMVSPRRSGGAEAGVLAGAA